MYRPGKRSRHSIERRVTVRGAQTELLHCRLNRSESSWRRRASAYPTPRPSFFGDAKNFCDGASRARASCQRMRKSNRAADCKAQYQRIAFERHPMSPLLRSASITREFTHLQVRHGHSQSHARPSPLPITSSHFARSGGETGFEQIRPHVDWHSEYANAIGPTLRASPRLYENPPSSTGSTAPARS